MPVELRLSSRLTLSGVVVAVLLSASSAFAGPSEDCAAGAAYGQEQEDYVAALRLCRPLAEQGDAKAQSTLGFMYDQGEGVQKDYAEAVQWYREAAEQGDAFAQSNLGLMYELGDEGVPQDYVLAHMWFNLAAAHSHADLDQYVALNPIGPGPGQHFQADIPRLEGFHQPHQIEQRPPGRPCWPSAQTRAGSTRHGGATHRRGQIATGSRQGARRGRLDAAGCHEGAGDRPKTSRFCTDWKTDLEINR